MLSVRIAGNRWAPCLLRGELIMAEVKRDVIEHIFDVKKDSGQTIQLNIMKWEPIAGKNRGLL